MYVCTFALCGYVTVDAAVILAGRTVLDQNGADIIKNDSICTNFRPNPTHCIYNQAYNATISTTHANFSISTKFCISFINNIKFSNNKLITFYSFTNICNKLPYATNTHFPRS